MWIYEKKLEYPIKITKPDARIGSYTAVSQPEVFHGNSTG